jgi:hypothetical protein
LLAKEKGDDPFGTHQALQNLNQAIGSGNAGAAVMADGALSGRLDAFQTMLQKAEGDPSDILLMVRWQTALYASKTQLQRLTIARHIVEESQEFIAHYGKYKDVDHAYHELMEELMPGFRQTEDELEKIHIDLQPEVHKIDEQMNSPSRLEKAHREYLMKLQNL